MSSDMYGPSIQPTWRSTLRRQAGPNRNLTQCHRVAASALLVAHCNRRIDAYASQGREEGGGRLTLRPQRRHRPVFLRALDGVRRAGQDLVVKTSRIAPTAPLATLAVATPRLLEERM